MGKARKKLLAKRKAKRINREQIKLAMNKRIYFTLTRCLKKLQGISHKYCYKSNMHNLIYKDAKFKNVRYQSSIITKCNFNQAELIGVDFCNCNLRKSSFKNAKLKNVCFINCNIEDADFLNANFENVVFVCVGTNKAKNLSINSGCKCYNTYPKFDLEKDMQAQLLQLSEDPLLYEPHVLHVTKNKLNFWTLKILEDLYGENVFEALSAIKSRKQKKGFYTLHSYMKHIESYLKL
ncbi:MAG: pentapeptide repeat-containing protein [Clostridia bacterium]|nr:pentapeptide repeat-containing protein [Clostridia bacterium]